MKKIGKLLIGILGFLAIGGINTISSINYNALEVLAAPEPLDDHICLEGLSYDRLLPTEGKIEKGNYYLNKDTVLTGELVIDDVSEVNICLNGYVLDLNEYHIEVSSCSLNIVDCSKNSYHYFDKTNTVWSLLNEQTENCETIKGGVITGALDCLLLAEASVVNITNVNLVGNNGNIILPSSILNFENSNILGNSCDDGDAYFIFGNTSEVEFSNTTIRYNEVAIFNDLKYSDILLNNVLITDNTTKKPSFINATNANITFAGTVKFEGNETSYTNGSNSFSNCSKGGVNFDKTFDNKESVIELDPIDYFLNIPENYIGSFIINHDDYAIIVEAGVLKVVFKVVQIDQQPKLSNNFQVAASSNYATAISYQWYTVANNGDKSPIVGKTSNKFGTYNSTTNIVCSVTFAYRESPVTLWTNTITYTSFTLTIDKNGADSSCSNKTIYGYSSYSSKLTDNGLTRSGYTLIGYSTNSQSTSTEYRVDDTYIFNKTTNTLYAIWVENIVKGGITYDKILPRKGGIYAGNYFLAEDTDLTGNIVFNAGVTNLFLNGKVLNLKGNLLVSTVEGTTINIIDNANSSVTHYFDILSTPWILVDSTKTYHRSYTGGLITGGTKGIFYGSQCVANFENISIIGNTGSDALSFNSGAIAVYNSSTVTLNNCNVNGNFSKATAGAVYGYSNSTLNIINSEIYGNISEDSYGAGIYADTCEVNIDNSVIKFNSAIETGGSGGGLALISSSLTLGGGTIITDNNWEVPLANETTSVINGLYPISIYATDSEAVFEDDFTGTIGVSSCCDFTLPSEYIENYVIEDTNCTLVETLSGDYVCEDIELSIVELPNSSNGYTFVISTNLEDVLYLWQGYTTSTTTPAISHFGTSTIPQEILIDGLNGFSCEAYKMCNGVKKSVSTGLITSGPIITVTFSSSYSYIEGLTMSAFENSTIQIPSFNITKTGYKVRAKIYVDTDYVYYDVGDDFTLGSENVTFTLFDTAKTYIVTLDNSAYGLDNTTLQVKYDLNAAYFYTGSLPYISGKIFSGYFTQPNGQGTRYLQKEGTIMDGITWNIDEANPVLYAYFQTTPSFRFSKSTFEYLETITYGTCIPTDTSGFTFKYKYKGEGASAYRNGLPTEPGEYNIRIFRAEDTTYGEYVEFLNLKIIATDLTLNLETIVYPYDGEGHEYTIDTEVTGFSFKYYRYYPEEEASLQYQEITGIPFTQGYYKVEVSRAADEYYNEYEEIAYMAIGYTVTFDLNGGTGTAPVYDSYYYGDFTLPNGTGITPKTGLAFAGWTDGVSLFEPFETVIITENTTFYAQYSMIIDADPSYSNSFTVETSYTGTDATYKWYANYQTDSLANQTSATLDTSILSQGGEYYCVISLEKTSVTSKTVKIGKFEILSPLNSLDVAYIEYVEITEAFTLPAISEVTLPTTSYSCTGYNATYDNAGTRYLPGASYTFNDEYENYSDCLYLQFDHVCDGTTYDLVLSNNYTTLYSGNYYLQLDLYLTQDIIIPEDANVNICLDGHTILFGEYTISIDSNATLTINNCNDTIAHYFTEDYVYSTVSDEVMMIGAFLTGSSNTMFNFGPKAILNLNNLKIVGNNCKSESVIYNNDTLNMNGCYVAFNETSSDYGIIRNNGDMVVNNCLFQSNTATNTGIIYNGSSRELTITNSNFLKNISKDGGAIYNAGKLEIDNTSFVLNKADNGGAIYQTKSATAECEDVSIFDNNAYYKGGAIYGGYISISGDSTIKGNTIDYCEDGELGVEYGGSAILLDEDTGLVLKGKITITNNEILIVSGGKIAFNETHPISPDSIIEVNYANYYSGMDPVSFTYCLVIENEDIFDSKIPYEIVDNTYEYTYQFVSGYYVEFNSNNKLVSLPETKICKENEEYIIPSSTSTSNAYKFLGWSENPNPTSLSDVYLPGVTITITNDVTLYAIVNYPITMTPVTQTETYNGSSFEYSSYGLTNSSITGFVNEYKLDTAADSTYTTTAPTNPGTYTIRITRAYDLNYYAFSQVATSKLVINKADIELDLSSQYYHYDGNEHPFVIDSELEGFTITYSVGTTPKNISVVNVSITRPADEYYNEYTGESKLTIGYGITYDANGGTGNVPTDNKYYVTDIYIDLNYINNLTKGDATFDGWSLSKNPTSIEEIYIANAKIMLANDITLYANYKKDITVTATTLEVTYNGASVNREFVVTDNLTDYNVLYKVAGTDYDYLTTTKPVDVGTYDVLVYRNGDVNYRAYSHLFENNIIINKAKVDKPQVSGTYTYNKSEQTVTLTGVESYMSTTDSLTKKNAGTYTITYTLDGNHEWNTGSDGVVTWTIEKLAIAEPVVTGTYVYNGENQTPTITGVDNDAMSFSTPTPRKDAATYILTYELDEDNYAWAEGSDGIVNWTIEKLKVDEPEVIGTYTYNKSEQTVELIVATYMSTKDSLSQTNAGSYDIAFDLDSNYDWADGSDGIVTWTIEKLAIAEPVVVGTYTYTGSEQTVVLEGYDADAMVEHTPDTGTNADLYTINYSLSSNYKWAEGSDGSIRWTIQKGQAVITVDTTTITKTYGETVTLPEATSNFGNVLCDSTGNSFSCATTYTVTYTVEGTSNFEGDTKTLTVIINHKDVEINWCEDDFTYNGENQTITATYKSYDGYTVSLKVTVNADFNNPGTYTATASFAYGESDYYALPEVTTKSYTMKKADVNIYCEDQSYHYDGYKHEYAIYSSQSGYTVTRLSGPTDFVSAGIYSLKITREEDAYYNAFSKNVSLTIGYSVTFDLNGGTGEAPVLYDYYYGYFMLPDAEITAPEGLEFWGWKQLSDIYAESLMYNVNSDITLYAAYCPTVISYPNASNDYTWSIEDETIEGITYEWYYGDIFSTDKVLLTDQTSKTLDLSKLTASGTYYGSIVYKTNHCDSLTFELVALSIFTITDLTNPVYVKVAKPNSSVQIPLPIFMGYSDEFTCLNTNSDYSGNYYSFEDYITVSSNTSLYLVDAHSCGYGDFYEVLTSKSSLSSGNYYLTSNLVLNCDMVVDENAIVNICLNGYAIIFNEYAILISDDAVVTIESCNDDVQHLYEYKDGKYVYNSFTDNVSFAIMGGLLTGSTNQMFLVKERAKLYIIHTNIVGNYTNDYSPIENRGTMYISYSNIQNNSCENYGGLFNNGGYISLTSTDISYNHSRIHGGFAYNYGTIIITGGDLNINSASDDGGLVYNDGTLELNAISAVGNMATNGGVVAQTSNGYTSFNDTIITGNTVTGFGGVAYGGSVLVADSTITYNMAYFDEGTYKEDYGGSAFYLDSFTTLTIYKKNYIADNHYDDILIGYSGLIELDLSDPTINNSTISVSYEHYSTTMDPVVFTNAFANSIGFNHTSVFTTSTGVIGITGDTTNVLRFEKGLTITYDANGGTGTIPTDSTLRAYGEFITLPFDVDLTSTGTFVGWSENSNPTSDDEIYDINRMYDYKVVDNVTLYAIYKKDISFLVPQMNRTYSGEEVVRYFDVLSCDYDTLVVYYKKSGAAASTYTTDEPVDAGTYDVKVYRAEDVLYNEFEQEYSNNIVISPKEITISWDVIELDYHPRKDKFEASYLDVNDNKISLDVVSNSGKVIDSSTPCGIWNVKAVFANNETNYKLPSDNTNIALINFGHVEIEFEDDELTYTYGDIFELPVGNEYITPTTSLTKADIVNVGDYSVVYTIDGDGENYSGDSKTLTIHIVKKEVSEPEVSGTYTYNKSLQTVTLTGVEDGMSTTDSLSQTNAGTYTITYTLDDNHKWAEGSDGVITWTIEKLAIDEPYVVGEYYFNGKEQTAVLEGLVEEAYASISSYFGTAVDLYTIHFNLKSNYKWKSGSDGVVRWQIQKGQASITVDQTPIVVTYGEAVTLPIATSEFGTISCDTKEGNLVDVGTYTVTYTIPEHIVAYFGDTKTVSVTINPLGVDEPQVSGTYTYTGNEQTVELTGVESYMSTTDSLTGKDANTYTITYTLDKNHTWNEGSDGTVTWTINKGQAVITVDTTTITKEYGEAISLPKATSNLGQAICDTISSSLVDVGTYTITFTVEGTANYDGDVKTVTVVINKAKVNEPEVSGTYTYTGNEQTVTLTGVESYMSTTSSLKGTNVDTYTITYTLDENYEWAEGSDGTITWSIEKAQAVISVDQTTITKEYGETVILPTATTNFGEVSCDMTPADLVNYGTYTVTYTVEGTSNYDGDVKTLTVIISKIKAYEPQVSGTYTYNGEEQTVALTGVESYMSTTSSLTETNAGTYKIIYTLDNNYEWAEGSDGEVIWTINKVKVDEPQVTGSYTFTGDYITVTLTGVESFMSTNDLLMAIEAGDHTITYTLDNNYEWAEGFDGVVTWTINKIKVDEPQVSGTYTYNGEEQTVTLTGVESYMSTTSSLTETNAGDHIITYTLDGNHEWNTGSDGNVTWTINKAQASITVDQATITKTYGETVTLPTATANFGTVSCNKSSADLVDANTYTVTYTVEETSNYYGDSKSLTVVINKAKVNEPQVTGSYTYTGSEQTVELTGVESYMSTTSSLTGKDVDTYTITYTLDGNHEWNEGSDGTITWSIGKTQATITVDTTTITKTYGETIELPTASSNVGEVVCDMTSADLVNVDTYTVTYTVEGTSNYDGDVKTLTVVINKLKVDEPEVSGEYTYTGKVQTVELTGVESYMSTTDSLNGTNVDTYTITYTLDGNHEWNEGSDGTITWSIGKAQATITVDTTTITKTYGQTVTLPEATTNFGEVSCDKTSADLVNVDTYTVTYTVEGTANYDGDVKTLTVVINKAKVDEPQVSGTYTYTGNEQTVTLSGVEDYMSTENSLTETDAGTYTITYTLDGNHEWNTGSDGVVTWTIEKLAIAEPYATGTYTYTGDFITVTVLGVESYMSTNDLLMAIEAGDHTITYTLDDNHEWKVGSDGTLTWTINKAKATITVDQTTITKTYGQTVTLPEATTTFGEVSCDKTSADLVNADTYTVTFTVEGTDNYDGDVKTLTVVIGKATVVAPSGVDSKVYTGNELTSEIEGTNYYSVANVTKTDVGVYDVVVTLKDHDNYKWFKGEDTATRTVKFEITKAQAVISVDTTTITKTYGENLELPEASSNVGEVVCDKTLADLVNAGTYTVTYKVENTSNYDGDTKTLTVVINKAKVDEPEASGTYIYTGKEQTVVLTGVEDYMLTNDSLTKTNVGNYEIVYTLDDNHEWNEGSDGKLSWSIEKATIVAPTTVDSKVYTGNELTSELAANDLYTITQAKGTNVGTYDVVVTLKDHNNYKWFKGEDTASRTLKFEITKAVAVISVDTTTITKTYGETLELPEASSNVGEVVCDKTLADLVNVGTYTITYTVVETTNFDGDTKTLTVVINKAKVDEPEVSGTYTYTGSEQTIVLTGVESYMSTTDSLKATNARTYTITYTLDDNHEWNENVDGKVSFTIEPKEIIIDWCEDNFVYNGNVQAIQASYKNIINNEVMLNVVVDKEFKEVGEYLATVSFANNETNYKLPQTITKTYEIHAQIINGVVEGKDVVFFENANGFAKDTNARVEIKYENGMQKDGVTFIVDYNSILEDESVYTIYDIKLVDKDGNEIVLDGTEEVTIKILIPEKLRNKAFVVLHVHSEDDVTRIESGEVLKVGTFIIEGDYIVTKINKLSEFAFIVPIDCHNHYNLFILLGLIIVLLLLIVKKDKFRFGTFIINLAYGAGIYFSIKNSDCDLCSIMVVIDTSIFIAIFVLCIFNKLFIPSNRRKNKKNKKQKEKSKPTKEKNIIEEVIDEIDNKPLENQTQEETKIEEPVKEEIKEEPIVEEANEITLKESIELAKNQVSSIYISKKAVYDYLASTYDDVSLNNRKNLTETGLPLADTHYRKLNDKKVCFAYVYEVDDKSFMILRLPNEQFIKNNKKYDLKKSAFPKQKVNWYTVIISEKFKSNEEVLRLIDEAYNEVKENEDIPSNNDNNLDEDIIQEIEKIVASKEETNEKEVTLKESLQEAKKVKSNMTKLLIMEHLEKYCSEIELNNRKNLTETGLPLADTHYRVFEDRKVCFAYVYEIDGSLLLLLRIDNDDYAKILKKKYNAKRSAFPKQKYSWYSIPVSDKFESNDEVYAILDEAFNEAN